MASWYKGVDIASGVLNLNLCLIRAFFRGSHNSCFYAETIARCADSVSFVAAIRWKVHFFAMTRYVLPFVEDATPPPSKQVSRNIDRIPRKTSCGKKVFGRCM